MSDPRSLRVEVGDCLEVLERLPAESIDAVVTDPPYGLEFMGEDWDKPWAVGFRQLGHEGAEDRRALPQHGSGRNPMCRSCRKHRRGAERCQCDTPDFDESPADAMRAFQAWCEVWARAVLRVLKPGGHVLAFGGSRTYHRLACAVEDAGFEIRDRMLTLTGAELGPEIDWLYGQGWPKSRNIALAIDRAAGEEPNVVAELRTPFKVDAAEGNRRAFGAQVNGVDAEGYRTSPVTEPVTDEAKQWKGWGTALKPAHEPIVVARKPFRGTVESQVLATGTGAVNVDACRIDTGGEVISAGLSDPANRRGVVGNAMPAPGDAEKNQAAQRASLERANALGRWPANVVLLHAPDCQRIGTRRVPSGVTVRRNLDPSEAEPGIFPKRKHPGGVDVTYGDGDGYETIEAWACSPGCPVAQVDELSGELQGGIFPGRRESDKTRTTYGAFAGQREGLQARKLDGGGASRFFYQAKASAGERDAGLGELEPVAQALHNGSRFASGGRTRGEDGEWVETGSDPAPKRNIHPTVKPIELMRWLIRLVTPPGGTVLDPFTGSGSTGCAAALEGVNFLGIERDPRFAGIARARIDFWQQFPPGTRVADVLEVEAAQRRERAAGEADRVLREEAGQLDIFATAEEER